MKYIGLILIFTISFTSSTIAQSSIGFSEPDSIRAILDYRLPDWGFTNIHLDFSLNGSMSNIDENLTTEPGNNVQFNLGPGLNRYRESEKRTFLISSQPMFEYSSSVQSQNMMDESEKSTNVTLPWSIRQKRFFEQSNLFLNMSNSGVFTNERGSTLIESGSSTINEFNRVTRFFISDLSFGIGYGRMRNVNPMIRSLRLAERYNDLENSDLPFSYNDIISASEQFTKREAYYQLYDRPMKYFWDDLNSVISPDLAALDPFDLLYLTDTELESIGSRFEGWEIDLSFGLIYNIFYLRMENLQSNTDFSDMNRFLDFAPRLSYRWFRNYSLKNQIGIQGVYTYRTSLYESSSNFFSPDHVFNSAISWIYNLTDRILANTALTYLYIGRELSQNYSLTHNFTAQTEINYFIENKVSLFVNSSLNFVKFESLDLATENGRRFGFNAGIRYFLKRDLY